MSFVPVQAVLAQASTIPEDSGGAYVIAAYVVFFVVILVYVAIMAQRLQRISKTADDLERRLEGIDHAQHQGAGAVQGGSVENVAATAPPTIAPPAGSQEHSTAGGPAS